jgi:hypothetical protein
MQVRMPTDHVVMSCASSSRAEHSYTDWAAYSPLLPTNFHSLLYV